MKINYKWVVFISFLALIFLPRQMPLEPLKWLVIILATVLCLLGEFYSLRDNPTPTETKQTWLLMLLTVIMAVVNFAI